MKTKSCYFEIVVVLLLSVIPWPGPSVFKISCPRDRASMVRRIVHKRWIPILKKYQVELPLECPFHESRDIFYPQQVAKIQHRTSQWTCGLCGKSFYAEKHLDAHFDSRHKSNVNTAEDAVCLANYCDIMRCDVLGMMELDGSLVDDSTGSVNTDIQVWRENTDSRVTPYVPCECRELARVYSSNVGNSDKSEIISTSSSYHRAHTKHCQTGERGTSQTASSTSTTTASSSGYHRDIPHDTDNKSSACDNDDNEGENDTSNLVEAALPSAGDRREKNRESEIRKLKSNCNPEELQKLKIQCEILVRDCIAGLLANLSIKDFQEIEGELNRAICWYLSCDRYWEDTKRHQRHTPWYLLVTFLFLLSSGISACYYVVSLLLSSGDDDCMDGSEDNPEFHDGPDRPSSSLHDPGGDGQSGERRKYEDEDRLIAAGAMPDHYIYVAYPPELKRRLLESCYNRTTRL